MKVVLHTKFGPPDELQLKDVAKPVIKDDEVLDSVGKTSFATDHKQDIPHGANIRSFSVC